MPPPNAEVLVFRKSSLLWLCSFVLACSGGSSAPVATPPADASPSRVVALTATPTAQLGTLPPGVGIGVGAKIPDTAAQDLAGGEVRLSTLHEYQPLLIVFYRGGWCPFCNLELQELGRHYADFKKRDTELVAISVDRPDIELSFKATNAIPFAILSDVDATVVEAFHVLNQLSPDAYTRMREKDVDIEQYAGRRHHRIAIPAFFLVDRHGVVRWAHADPRAQVRPTTAQLLAAIDASFAPDER